MTRIASMRYSFFWKRKQHPPERIFRETQVCSHIWRSPHLWFLPLPFFWKMIQQKSLEWTSGKGLLLPPWLTIQGSLSVSHKEEVVNKVIL